MESFHFYINSGGGGQIKPFGSVTPHAITFGSVTPGAITFGSVTPGAITSLSGIAGLAALKDAGDSARREAMLTWLQDNIVPLVGPDATEALGGLLKRTALRDEANDFVDKILEFRMHLERGIHTPDGAMDEWRSRQRKKD